MLVLSTVQYIGSSYIGCDSDKYLTFHPVVQSVWMSGLSLLGFFLVAAVEILS